MRHSLLLLFAVALPAQATTYFPVPSQLTPGHYEATPESDPRRCPPAEVRVRGHVIELNGLYSISLQSGEESESIGLGSDPGCIEHDRYETAVDRESTVFKAESSEECPRGKAMPLSLDQWTVREKTIDLYRLTFSGRRGVVTECHYRLGH